MTIYFCVTKEEIPNPLPKKCYIIEPPLFIEEIEKHKYQMMLKKMTTVNCLRLIVDEIAQKYDTSLNAFHVNLDNYSGIKFETTDDLSKIINRVFADVHPKMFNKVLDYKIKSIPIETKVIFYVGKYGGISIEFSKNNVEFRENKDMEQLLSEINTNNRSKPKTIKN